MNVAWARYRPRNLLVSGITPGPSEFTTEQLQVFMKTFVDDLIKLYEDGVLIRTPLYPHGRCFIFAPFLSNISILRSPRAVICSRSLLRPSRNVSHVRICGYAVRK